MSHTHTYACIHRCTTHTHTHTHMHIRTCTTRPCATTSRLKLNQQYRCRAPTVRTSTAMCIHTHTHTHNMCTTHTHTPKKCFVKQITARNCMYILLSPVTDEALQWLKSAVKSSIAPKYIAHKADGWSVRQCFKAILEWVAGSSPCCLFHFSILLLLFTNCTAFSGSRGSRARPTPSVANCCFAYKTFLMCCFNNSTIHWKKYFYFFQVDEEVCIILYNKYYFTKI